MRTRCIIVFKNKYLERCISVNSNVYPFWRLNEIQKFLVWNKPRNGDVTYSAANYVLWHKINTIKRSNEFYGGDESKQIKTLDDILKPIEDDDFIHRGIGVQDSTSYYRYWYKYTVDFDTETIRVDNHETSVTVTFDQVVEFDNKGKILEPQIPAN